MTFTRWMPFGLVLTAIACSSGGAAWDWDKNGGGPSGPSGNDQGAPTGDQQAPTNGQASSTTSDAPTSDNQSDLGSPVPVGGKTTDVTCAQLCQQAANAGCDVGALDSCASECADALDEYGDCSDEILAFVSCWLASGEFSCNDQDNTEVNIEDIQACYPEAEAFASCYGVIEHQPEPDPGAGGSNGGGGRDCSPEQGCNCGTDICASCMCAAESAQQDPGICTQQGLCPSGV